MKDKPKIAVLAHSIGDYRRFVMSSPVKSECDFIFINSDDDLSGKVFCDVKILNGFYLRGDAQELEKKTLLRMFDNCDE